MSVGNKVYSWDSEKSEWVDLGQIQGAKGDKGNAGTIAIGNVEDGENVSVTNVGTNTNAVLNFILRRGEKGERGGAGTIAIGNVTSGDTPSVENVGTPENAVLDFVIPSGEKGERGNPANINGKEGTFIWVYASDIPMEEESEISIADELGNISETINSHWGNGDAKTNLVLTQENIAQETKINNKADKTSLDGWTSVQTLSVGATSISFNNLNSSKAYDLYAETSDGSLVTIKSCAKTNGTQSGTIKLTYTIKALTSAQGSTKFKLRILN